MPPTTHAPQPPLSDAAHQPVPSTSLATASPYVSLDSENGGIRLLELAPGKHDDDVKIRLIPMNLCDDSNPPYEALSYVWGTEMAAREAVVNGVSIAITSNLDSALRHLRFTIVPRLMWIDAVAINQGDTQERNHQVQMMGRIYSTASQVVVWLGDVEQGDRYTRVILSAMQLLWSHENPSSVALFDYLLRVVALLAEDQIDVTEAEDYVLQSLYRLIERPWFSRIWVVQELALSKAATVRIGLFSFPWQPFETFIKWFPKHKTDLLNSGFIAAAARVSRATRESHFVSQLCRTLHLTASDPRDKVYGILGISTFSGLPIRPNYAKSVQTVFAEAAASLLNEGQWSVYMHIPLQPWQAMKYDVLPGLPSWVPNLTIEGAGFTQRPRPTEPQEVSYIFPTRPSSTTSSYELYLSPKCSANLTTLCVTGRFLGNIVETSGNRFDHIYLFNPDAHLEPEILDFYHTSAKPAGISPALFISTLINSPLPASHATNAQLSLLDPETQRARVPTHTRRERADVCTAVRANLKNRTLVITDAAQLGLSYHPQPDVGIRAGDVLVALFQSDLPFILRPHGDGRYGMMNVARVNIQTFYQHDSDPSLQMRIDGVPKFKTREFVIV